MRSKACALVFLAIIWLLAWGCAQAIPGDCDQNGSIGVGDITALADYLFGSGVAPLVPADCDCDNFPGINWGDIMQIVAQLYIGGATLYPSPGTDVAVPSNVKFYFNQKIDFGANPPIDRIQIIIDVPAGTDLYGFTLPFTYAPDVNETDIVINSISMAGSVYPAMQVLRDDPNKKFLLYPSTPSGSAIIAGGTKGPLCTVRFDLNGPVLNPTPVRWAFMNHFWPMLFAEFAYSCPEGERVFLPALIRAAYGDANCDGFVDVSDAVWIINYVFVGGPPPGECEP